MSDKPGLLLDWVLALHWTEQAKLVGAFREPDSETPEAVGQLVRWVRGVCCHVREDSAYFIVSDYSPTPEAVIDGMAIGLADRSFPEAARDALRVISMHAPAPVDRAMALRYLTPLIRWTEEDHEPDAE